MKFRPGILAAALAVTHLPALTWAQTPVTFGVKAGVNSSTLSVEDNSGLETSRIWGAVAGVFLGKNVNEKLSFQVEGLFSQRGAKDTTTPSNTKIRLTYLDIPVVARLGNTTTSATHFHVLTGPQVSLKLKAEGIQIGSVNDGKHAPGSYHYQDLAFDVPASQVPVGREQALSRRVGAILGMT